MEISKEFAYLIGLICGRGHLIEKDKKIVIEFAHKNKIAYGISYCLKCGQLATSQGEDKETKELICKVCKSKVPSSTKKAYEQKESTMNSLQDEIIPFLKLNFNVEFDIVGNDHLTFLILDFKEEDKFNYILKLFKSKTGFDSFEIPEIMRDIDYESKIEFINGLMDTAGFFNSGSWMPRKGKKGYGVMRGYFQIVRNWKMPINICDYLNENFKLNIQTIDWGHPNMRDQAKIYAWAREHQVKFFPEKYDIFRPKLKHKREMFEELVNHNKKVDSDTEDSFGLSKINRGQIKPYHPEENSKKLPSELKGKHFDSSWQIALELGCRLIKKEYEKAKNKQIVYLIGIDKEGNKNEIEKELEGIRKTKTQEVERLRKKNEEKVVKREEKRMRTNPEQKLYAPLCEYLGKFFSEYYKEKVVFYDTSSFYLHKFISESEFGDELEYYDEYKIKPDLVGFVMSSNQILMVEVKATGLSLKDLGQLRGYCLIVKPEYALLVSNKEPSINLKKIIKLNEGILSYDNKKIKIGLWNGKEVNIIKDEL
jgi:hypothetical protein